MFRRNASGVLSVLLLLLAPDGRAQSDPGAPSAEPVPGFASVDIGGRSLRYRCTGRGVPTVIIEPGGGVSLETVISWNLTRGWPAVIPAVAKTTRVCAYDRAGLGRSDKAALPRTSRDVAADLHLLLEKAGIQPPYVLAGQSFGGMNVRMFTHLFPDTVAGLVLIDSSLPDLYPVFHITAITHRKDAVYPATIVGIPPMEDFYIGSASLRLFMPIFRMNFPEIIDIALPAEGVFHNMVFVSIKKTYPMQAFKIMHGLWGMGQMMFSKYIMVVDHDVDVHNTSDVLFRLCANTDPQRDAIFTKGPADVLDHATPDLAVGSKLGIDATKKLAGEGFKRDWPPLIKMDKAIQEKMDRLFSGK